eukprot:m.86979 g.86979  ORF g.86979 m.86979 type:complete len:946 (+) comp9685_c0_seq1:61-2898(+)
MMEGAWLEASLSDYLPGSTDNGITALPYDLDVTVFDTFDLPTTGTNDVTRSDHESSVSPTPVDPISTPMAPLSPPDSARGWSGASIDGSSSDSEEPHLGPHIASASGGPSSPLDVDAMAVDTTVLAAVPPAVAGMHVPHHHHHHHQPPPAVMSMPAAMPHTHTHNPVRGMSAPVSPVSKAAPTSLMSHEAMASSSSASSSSAVPRNDNGGGAGKASTVVDKQRRKSAHNAIERRYRNSINDKIAELRLRLPDFLVMGASKGAKAQMNKSKVIQKGIEYIAHLETSNAELLAENERLRMLVPGASHSSADSAASSATDMASPSAKRTKIKVEAESGRFLLCVMGCGLVAVTVTGNGPMTIGGGGGGGILSSNAAAHAGGRVLAGTANPEDAWGNQLDALTAAAIHWLWYLFVFAVCAAGFLKEDVVTDPTDAVANEAKCRAAEAEGNAMKQKYYATTALALVGAQPTAGEGASLVYAFVSCVVRQVLHRLYVGVWIDRLLVSRSNAAIASAQVCASMNQALLHACISRNMETPARSGLQRLVLALRALNAAEAAGSELDPLCLIKAYVSVAAQIHLVVPSDLASVVNDYYVRQARSIYWQTPESFPQLAWLFRPNGHAFFRGGSWTSKVPTDSSWKRLYPGTLEHLQATYHVSLLEQGLVEIMFGTNTDKVQDVFEDVRESAGQCGDTRSLWWGTLGVAHVCWRKGQKQTARRYICELDGLALRKSKIEHFAYATARAHLALLDGDQQLCWQALEVASNMCTDWASVSPSGDADTSLPFERFARLLGHQQLLNTRVALVRLRVYLKQKDTPLALGRSDGEDGDVAAVSHSAMLAAVQRDIGELRRFSHTCAAASSSLLKYQAIHRSLAGGRVTLTEHMFHQSLKSAKQLGLPYEEASTLLHSVVHLHSTMPKHAVRDMLNRAVTIFEQMQAAEELQTSRKLLQLVL